MKKNFFAYIVAAVVVGFFNPEEGAALETNYSWLKKYLKKASGHNIWNDNKYRDAAESVCRGYYPILRHL